MEFEIVIALAPDTTGYPVQDILSRDHPYHVQGFVFRHTSTF